MIDLNEKMVLITGGNSMIGRACHKFLEDNFPDCFSVPIYHRKSKNVINNFQFDLLDINSVNYMFREFEPDYVIHCAGYNGNLQFTKKYGDEIFRQTTQMGMNVLHASKVYGAEKVLSVIPSCAYPPDHILYEVNLLDGNPHSSVNAHAYAKRNLFIYGKILTEVSKTAYISVILNNCTGPYDSFDVDKTKVFGGLIKKFCDAVHTGAPGVECFGTGVAFREFLFSEDAGTGIVKALQMYDNTDVPLNIGHGKDYSIKEIAETIARLTGFDGVIGWNSAYPDGALKKLLCVDRMKAILQWEPQVGLEEGLSRTIEFYRKNYLDNC